MHVGGKSTTIGHAARRASRRTFQPWKHVCRYSGALGCGEMPRVTIASRLLFTRSLLYSPYFLLIACPLRCLPSAAWRLGAERAARGPRSGSRRRGCSPGTEKFAMAEMMDLDEESRKQLDRWVEAKRSRDFATADRIRSLLEAKGIKPDQARPHVWEPPSSRRQGSHGPPPPNAIRMGNRAMMDSGMERGNLGDKPIRGMPSFGAISGAASSAPRPGMPPGIDASVGDWLCSACGNWNWARRKECNQCGSGKNGLSAVKGTMVGTKRDGEGGGFKEFDDEAVRASRRPYPDATPNGGGATLPPPPTPHCRCRASAPQHAPTAARPCAHLASLQPLACRAG